jgi:hypothetical protein
MLLIGFALGAIDKVLAGVLLALALWLLFW